MTMGLLFKNKPGFRELCVAAAILTGLMQLSCTGKSAREDDLRLIGTIENNLLPSILIEGEEQEGFNILERMDHYKVPGVSMAFLNRGEIVWSRGYGYAYADSSSRVDAQTLFQAASISKPVAALAALAMVEEGKIGLDEDVNLYLEGWQVEENGYTEQEKVTLRRILSHSAGLTVHGFAGYAAGEEIPDLVQILNGEAPANSGRIYPDTIPGSLYRYSGGGYTIMQKMLTDVSGKPFPELMDEYVLSRIGMESSTYVQPLPEDLYATASAGHLQNGEMIEGRWHIYPEMAAAGLWTTPTDLLKYAMEVQQSNMGTSNRILSQQMTAEMLTPQINNHGLGPGTGGEDGQKTFGHGGSNAGFRCQLIAFVETGQGVAVMTNSDMGGYLMDEILRSFSRVYKWNTYKPEIKKLWPLNEEDLEAFTGQYRLNYAGQDLVIDVSLLEKHLKGVQLWNDFSFEIYPESGNGFFNPEDGMQCRFEENQEGITELIILEFGNEYRFVRI
jgi:CubicO group peptidase (beta-lactamase class C family)